METLLQVMMILHCSRHAFIFLIFCIDRCDQKYCTSPDELGNDCWAGAPYEGPDPNPNLYPYPNPSPTLSPNPSPNRNPNSLNGTPT